MTRKIPLVCLMLVVAFGTGHPPPAIAQPEQDPAIAITTVQLDGGEMAWHATVASTIAESDPPVEIRAGFVAALDDPLLLLFDGGARLERLPADTALALPEPLEGHPVSLLSDASVPYLGVELLAFDAATTDPESVPFTVEAGEYNLTLWRLDPALPLEPDDIERLGALQLPMLAYVRDGAVDVPSTTGGAPERLEAGSWTVIAPGVTLTPREGEDPPILLLATLDQAQAEASDEPAVSQPQGGGTTRQPSTGQVATQVATTAATQPPTLPPTTAPTEAPPSTVVPSDIPAPGPDEGGFDPGPGDVEQDCADFFADSDGDGITDQCEIEQGTDPNVPNTGNTGPGGSAGASGCTADLVILCVEEGSIVSRGTGPIKSEAENGISVVDEAGLGCGATLADADGDGLVDACEAEYGTDPARADTDDDGLSDSNELRRYGTNPKDPDTDRDGLGDGFDLAGGTNPLNQDFDSDGLLDGEEVNTYGTYPKVADTDGDGLTDGDEVTTHRTDPLVGDSDGDCHTDLDELSTGTDPLSQDSDGDGTLDRVDQEPANSAVTDLVYEGFDWCG